MIQKSSPAAQESPADQPAAAARPANRNITDWEKSAIAEISLCLEVTAYIYHWQ
jgi:hypothetical protein